MSTRATYVYQQDSAVIFLETSDNPFLEWKEVVLTRTTIALACHPKIEVIKLFRVFRKLLPPAVLGAEGFLERTVSGVSRVLILGPREEGRKRHSCGSNDIVGMIHARFELRNSQILCDVVWNECIDASLTNGMHRDKV